jgi:hypothetical protein
MEITHRDIAASSVTASVLLDEQSLRRLDLRRYNDGKQKFLNSNGDARTIQELIADGAEFEDNNIRALNHFFDPLHDAGVAYASPDWALEDRLQAVLQDFSLRDARDYTYAALTAVEKSERSKKWGMAFESFGHVIHHVQDMAQPQHVRMDSHLEVNDTLLTWSRADGTKLDSNSRFEIYARKERPALLELMRSVPAATALPGARHFWTNSAGTGMADYTNRNFVSQGTNFLLLDNGNVSPSARYVHPEPTAAPTQIVAIRSLFEAAGKPLPEEVAARCPDANTCKVLFFGTTLTQRASSLSIFDQDLKSVGRLVSYIDPDTRVMYLVSRLFALNRFNFDAVLELLVPKALSYSTGLINYFFRGRLELGTPAGFAPGSSRVALTVRNRSTGADINGNPVAELMATGSEGTLIAIAKFDTPRATDQILKSNVQGVPATINSAAPSVEFTFENDARIPADATNLRLQVVFQGQLGFEQGAVVAETIDAPATGFVVVSDYVSPTKMFDAATLRPIAQIPALADADSYLLSITPDNRRVFRSEFDSEFGFITVIDTKSFSVVATVPTGFNWPEPTQSIVSPDGNFLYVVLATGQGDGASGFGGALASIDLRELVVVNGQPMPNPNLYKLVQVVDVPYWPWNIQISSNGRQMVLSSSWKGGTSPDGREGTLPFASQYAYHYVSVAFDAQGRPSMRVDRRFMPNGPYMIKGFALSENGYFLAHATGAASGYPQGESALSIDPDGRPVLLRQFEPDDMVPGTNLTRLKTPEINVAIDVLSGALVGSVKDDTPLPEWDYEGVCERSDGPIRYVLDNGRLIGERIRADGSIDEFASYQFDFNDSPNSVVCSNQKRIVSARAVEPLTVVPPPSYCAISEATTMGTGIFDLTSPHYALQMPRRYKARIKRHMKYPAYFSLGIASFPVVVFELWNERRDYFLAAVPFQVPFMPSGFISHAHVFQVSCTPGSSVSFAWAGDMLSDYVLAGDGYDYAFPAAVMGVFDAWRTGDDPATKHRVLADMIEDRWYEIVFANATADPAVSVFSVEADSGLPPTHRQGS